LGGALGGIWMEETQAYASAWTNLGAFLLCGMSIGIGRTALHGIITFAHFTGQIVDAKGIPMPADKVPAVKQHSLDENSEKFIGTSVDPGSQIRMHPESECLPEHARVYPKGGRLYLVAREGDIYTLDGQLLVGPQLLTDGREFQLGKAILTYHEQRR
jgi:hypothetical protein